MIGFFLPGDSLLFAAGFLASQNVFNFWLLNLCLCTAGILGDAVNYYIGRKTTETVFDRGHFRFIKREHLLADGGLPGAVGNVLQLRRVELAGAIERGVSVLKARGARHAGDLRPLMVGPMGVAVGEGFAPARGGLTGEEWKRVVVPAHTGRRRTLTGFGYQRR